MWLSCSFIGVLKSTGISMLWLLMGLAAGFLLFMLIYLIMSIINICLRKKTKKASSIKPTSDPNEIIKSFIDQYYNESSNLKVSLRVVNAKDLTLKMIKDIAKAYYPNKKEPYLEISIEDFFILANDAIKKIDNAVSDITNSKLFKLVYGGVKTFDSVSSFFKTKFLKKEDTERLPSNINDLKISYVFNKIDEKKQKVELIGEKKNKDDKKEQTYFMINGLINNKITDVIKEIGKEAMLVYSNELKITTYALEEVKHD